MFDVTTLTLDEIGAEIDKTLDKLERLQALYAAAQAQDSRRVAKLVKEYNRLKRKEAADAPVGEGRSAEAGEAASVAGAP